MVERSVFLGVGVVFNYVRNGNKVNDFVEDVAEAANYLIENGAGESLLEGIGMDSKIRVKKGEYGNKMESRTGDVVWSPDVGGKKVAVDDKGNQSWVTTQMVKLLEKWIGKIT